MTPKQQTWCTLAQRLEPKGWKLGEDQSLTRVNASGVEILLRASGDGAEVAVDVSHRDHEHSLRILVTSPEPEAFLGLVTFLVQWAEEATIENYERALHPVIRRLGCAFWDGWSKPPVSRSDLDAQQVARVEALVRAFREHAWALTNEDWQEVWEKDLARVSPLVAGEKAGGLGAMRVEYFPGRDFLEVEVGSGLRLRLFPKADVAVVIGLLDGLGENLSPDWQSRMQELCHDFFIDKPDGWRTLRRP